MFSIYEGVHKLSTDRPLDDPWIAIGVLVLSLALLAVGMAMVTGNPQYAERH